jgi:hypothetical protein
MSTAQEQVTEAPVEEIEVEAETVEAPEAEAGEQGAAEVAAAAKASEVEELAREMGWAPQNEWRGPKESWKSAKEYIRHGSVIQRDLKSRNDIAQRDFQERLDRMDRANQIALKNQRKQLDDGWKARMREAVTLGDTEAFDRASQAREVALNKFDEEAEVQAPPKAGKPADLPPEVIDFGRRNAWFERDPIMTDVAVGISRGLEQRYPSMPLKDRLENVEKEMRRRFPEEFGQPNGNGNGNGSTARAPQVEGGLRPIKTSVKKGWESLPGEAKTAGMKYVKEGLFKTKEDYAASYYEQEQ